MKKSTKACLYVLMVLHISTQCGGRPDFELQPLVINEFVAKNSVLPDREEKFNSWVELLNSSEEEINLSKYSLSIDTINHVNYNFPEMVVAPGAFVIVHLSGESGNEAELHAPFKFGAERKYIALLHSNEVEDLLSFVFPPDDDESIGRNPVKTAEWIHYRQDQVSPGKTNMKPGLWKKIANRTQFEPRDSSPNAVLVYKGKIWVLAGYRFTGTDWESRSDVWSSIDGVRWDSVNSQPPFDPYSAFVVFRNKMWAFSSEGSFSSTDGIDWKNEAPGSFPGGYGARVTMYKNELWFYNEGLIGRSSDGRNWQIVVSEMPWKGKRLWPGFLAHQGKLYFFGGGIDYMTGNDHYFNDVWSSSDGINWEQLTANAQWAGRFWFSYASFDSKLWIMGGWNFYNDANSQYGNLKDVWVSEYGNDWRQLLDSSQWTNRHAPLTWVKNNALYISSGYGGGGTSRMYNDVWVCTNKRDREVSDMALLMETLHPGDRIAFNQLDSLNLHSSDEKILHVQGNEIAALDTGHAIVRVFIEGDNQFYPFYVERRVTVALDAAASVTVYPNPFNVELKVLLPLPPQEEDYLEIYNVNGQLQLHTGLSSFSNSINMPLRLPPGTYIYKVQNHGAIYKGRLVVQ